MHAGHDCERLLLTDYMNDLCIQATTESHIESKLHGVFSGECIGWRGQRLQLRARVAAARLVGMVTIFERGFNDSLRMRIMYCVIFVSRCLFLCTRNLGQNARCSSICASC